ncbi:igE-binding protein-like [Kogia breviceps]|uniref:igE-binding protein-like n=1 Tax=Kogia breviceps TaxID=27615 RepID=UPI0034D2FEC1
MGNSSSAEPAIGFHELIQALLRDWGLKLSQKTISKLLQDIDGAAPWFAVSGSLTVPSWERLGRDLTEHSKLGELSRGTLPLWRLIHSCLKGGGCEDIIQWGRKALSMCQDSASEGENVGTTVNRPKNPRRRKEKQAEKQEPAPGLYPHLDEFKALYLSQDELSPKEEADLEEAAAEYERGQYGSSPCARPPLYAPAVARASAFVQTPASAANAPCVPQGPSKCTFIPREAWSQVPMAFPAFEDPATRQRYYEMIDHRIIKDLAEAARGYGVTANYTLMLLQRLTRNALTPTDWQDIARACLSMGQYLDWKSILTDLAYSQARENAAHGQPAWNVDMLLGQGQWLNNQTAFPVEVYGQINQINMQAWRALPNKGEVSGNLTKIIQGSTEAFSDFVARMMEAAGRIFGSVEDAMPLVKQLIYEQVQHVITHCLEAWAAWGKPTKIKTDNGPAYSSKSFALFCQRMQVLHVTGLPYNPQGQGIIERANRTLKELLFKQKGGIAENCTPKQRLSLALFTINFLNVHDDDKTAAERHVALTHKEYGTMMWKDVLSNQWKGPDRVIARSRGSLCVSPQDQDPIWVPSRLTRSVEEKLERDTDCRTDDATMDNHALNKRLIGGFLAGNWSLEAERMILKQKIQILRLNATKLEPVTFGDFTSWLSSAFSFFKEWVGIAIFAACCLFGIVLCLWLVCRIRIQARRDKVLLTQALLAISEGDSPAAWLSALNNSR